ncbi:MAG: L,D-transpeptidase [Candidatus Methylacidiphilaceae bacterium]
MIVRRLPPTKALRRFAAMMLILSLAFVLFWTWRSLLLWPFRLEQCVLVVIEGADSWQGRLSCWKRVLPGGGWTEAKGAIPVLLGRNGVAWGIGLHPPQPGPQKEEGDGRTPAGRFRLGLVLGTAPSLPQGAKWRLYHRKSPQDAWIENPELPQYNHLVTIPNDEAAPDWFSAERLRIEDPVLEWMIFVEHNYPASRPGSGSAVFIHGRYGEHAATSGCLALEKKSLLELIRWLDPRADPELLVLTKEDYLRLWRSWALPNPGRVGLLQNP